jgi:hypothetical protein
MERRDRQLEEQPRQLIWTIVGIVAFVLLIVTSELP